MKDCIFCQIVAGKIPCHKVYEDKDFLGFLDIRPFNPGHSLIIPKKHYRWVWEVEKVGKYWEAANKTALSILKVLKPDKICFFTIGELVAHAHIQVLPRYPDDGHGALVNIENRKKISN